MFLMADSVLSLGLIKLLPAVGEANAATHEWSKIQQSVAVKCSVLKGIFCITSIPTPKGTSLKKECHAGVQGGVLWNVLLPDVT